MPIEFDVEIHAHVAGEIRRLSPEDQSGILRFLDVLSVGHDLEPDYVETDDAGREIRGRIAGRHAVLYWADHAVRSVRIIDLLPADPS